MAREDKRHPADSPAQVHECADCGRTSVLTIFRNEGLCHNCKTKRDIVTVQNVADKISPHRGMRAEVVENKVIDLASYEERTEQVVAKETIIWCDTCARHVVAEQGQDCAYCNGGR